ncbi:MAG TPA: flagellar motor switch protein FliM, partial [Spirochaetes bacterium]|nr:flagellar motor switch protein FliM [Spirochaetota bacterium]
EGDIIKLPSTKVTDTLMLKIGNVQKFYCRPGVVGKRMAVQIDRPIEEIDRDISNVLAEGEERD